MNERLEVFRKRLREEKPKPKQMKIKDWWSVMLSTLAFTVSATGFYLNTIEQSEVLSAALYSLPEVRVQNEKFALEGSMRVVFINSGNQHAAIMGMHVSAEKLCINDFSAFMEAIIEKTEMRNTEPCYGPDERRASHTVIERGFVIKPGEIVVKEIEITPYEVRPRPLNEIKSLDLAFEFYFTTPSSSKGTTRANVTVSGLTDFGTTIKNDHNAELRPIVIRSQTNNFMKAWWNDRFYSTSLTPKQS